MLVDHRKLAWSRTGEAMRRREFIKTIGGGAVAWPFEARTEQRERMRRVGVLMSTAADDTEGRARMAAFLGGLQKLGWIDGRNVRIDARWPSGSGEEVRKFAAELAALAPDVILATGVGVGPLQQATQTVPIVFVLVNDPVGAGYVASLARPGGNTT